MYFSSIIMLNIESKKLLQPADRILFHHNAIKIYTLTYYQNIALNIVYFQQSCFKINIAC